MTFRSAASIRRIINSPWYVSHADSFAGKRVAHVPAPTVDTGETLQGSFYVTAKIRVMSTSPSETTKLAQRAAVIVTRTNLFEGEPWQQNNCPCLRATGAPVMAIMTFRKAQRGNRRQLARVRTIAVQCKSRVRAECTPVIASVGWMNNTRSSPIQPSQCCVLSRNQRPV